MDSFWYSTQNGGEVVVTQPGVAERIYVFLGIFGGLNLLGRPVIRMASNLAKLKGPTSSYLRSYGDKWIAFRPISDVMLPWLGLTEKDWANTHVLAVAVRLDTASIADPFRTFEDFDPPICYTMPRLPRALRTLTPGYGIRFKLGGYEQIEVGEDQSPPPPKSWMCFVEAPTARFTEVGHG